MVSVKQKLSSSPNNQRITEITNYNDFRTSEMISVLSISNWLTGIRLSCPLIISLFQYSTIPLCFIVCPDRPSRKHHRYYG